MDNCDGEALVAMVIILVMPGPWDMCQVEQKAQNRDSPGENLCVPRAAELGRGAVKLLGVQLITSPSWRRSELLWCDEALSCLVLF